MTGFAMCCFLTWTLVPHSFSHVFLASTIDENIMEQNPFCFYAGKLETVFSVDKVGFYLLGALFL